MSISFESAQQQLPKILDILAKYRFKHPAFVHANKPDADLTLVVEPDGQPTLLSMVGAINEFREKLNLRIDLTTADVMSPEERDALICKFAEKPTRV